MINGNFLNHYEGQLAERQMFKYPPFFRLIELTIKHKDKAKTHQVAGLLAMQLRAIFGNRVLGPHEPPVNRIQRNNFV